MGYQQFRTAFTDRLQLAQLALAGLNPDNAQQQVVPGQQAPGGDLTQPIEQPATPPLSITPEVIDAVQQHPDREEPRCWRKTSKWWIVT